MRMQPPPQASPGFLRMLEEALHAEEHGKAFGGAHTPACCKDGHAAVRCMFQGMIHAGICLILQRGA